MISLIFCLTVLSALVCSTSLEHFKNVSDSVPMDNIYIPYEANRMYRIDLSMSPDRAAEVCAGKCLEIPYLCRYFMVYEELHNMGNRKERFCQLFSTLGTKFGESRINPYRANIRTLAAYEQRNKPTEQDLIKRFSLNGSRHELEQQLNTIANKYAISTDDQDNSSPVLKHLKTVFDSMLPTTVNIDRWLKGFDISKARVNTGNEYKLALKKGLQSWNEWPASENSPLEFSDIVVLTFIEIFFRNLNQGIKTVFDPVAKILIIEGQKVHMMIHSFGPGDYVILNGRNRTVDHGRIECNKFYLTNVERKEEEMKTSIIFPKAMEHFHHQTFFEEALPLEYEIFGNKLELGVQVVVNAISLGLLSRSWIHYFSNGLDVLYRDVVTAVISEVFGNESKRKFQLALQQTLKRTYLQSKMIDASIIISGNYI